MLVKSSARIFGPLALILFCGLFSALPAAGQEPAAAAEETDTAKDYFERGVILYGAGDYKGALKNFLKSFEMKPHFKIRFNIGLCYHKMGKNAAAANELHLYMIEQGDDPDTMKILEQLQEKTGILYIGVDTKAAEVLVDKVSYGLSPLNRAIYVEPGNHTIEVVAADGSVWSGTVDLKAGTSFQVNVVLVGGQKTADVKKVEEKPVTGEAAGTEAATLPEKPEKKRGKGKKISPAYFYAALGLTLASAVVGGVAGGLALKKSGELDDLDSDCQESGCDFNTVLHEEYLAKRQDLYDEADTWADVGTAFLVIGSAAAVAAIVLGIFSLGKKEKKSGNALSRLRPEILVFDRGAGLKLSF
jgi:tetratricopeptide (TPR) repeat protein